MKIKYEMIIYWSEVDEAFLVEIPELPGCMAAARPIKKLSKMLKWLFKNGLILLNL
jgi:predicted RNase H-like HicB family nuclease